MLKYIFSALLIAAVWTVALLLDLPYKFLIAGLATGLILIILITIVLVRMVRARNAAREIERALKAQADAHAARARPDLRGDIDAMQGEFLKAVAALKSSKLGGKRGTEALYALPWYMIIGPPGSGKSTALRNSGLRFPYMSKSGGAVQGVGGTRNCQWWMTNEAVILDTAGRYTTEDADRDEWIAFLELLRKNRTKQPINGVLVAIAVGDLIEAHPEDCLARAREIRARIDEVMSRLEMVVPVYVLFTKCDLLPGFVEMFEDLGNADRAQIWGFTVPVTGKVNPAAAFREHFNELAQVLERRSIRRIADARSFEARDKIFAFPQYFEPMRDNLATFVGELMADSIYTESPIFRGAYFTSGTQEGRPVDRIMNAMAEAFGVHPQMQMLAAPTEGKSYFLGDVFQRVVFPDRNVATRSAARLRRQAFIGHGIAAGLLLLAGAMAALPILSFAENRRLLLDTKAAVKEVETHRAGPDSVDPIEVDRIEPLRAVERQFREHETFIPLLMRMGMYQGDKYGSQVRRLYVKTLREEVVQPLHKLEIVELQNFVQRFGPIDDEPKPDEQVEYRNRLRLYLLLTGPLGPGEPGLQGEEKQWLNKTLTEVWKERLDKLQIHGEVTTMTSLVEAYADALEQDPELLFERDTTLVANARKILNRKDRTQALLAELLSDMDFPDLTLTELTDSREAVKSDKLVIKGLYTRTAWDEEIRERLANPFDRLAGDEWVLGLTAEDAKESREKLIEDLNSTYLKEYIAEWDVFLRGIYVATPKNNLEAQTIFTDLTRSGTPPFKRLSQYIYYHTNLPGEPVPEEDPATEAGLSEAEKLLRKKSRTAGKAVDLGRKLLGDREKAKKARNPLITTIDDVADVFEPIASFGYAPPPVTPENGLPPPQPAVPLDTYQEEIKRVRDALRAQIDVAGEAEQTALENSVKSAIRVAQDLLNSHPLKEWRPTEENWLLPPLNVVGRLLGESVVGAAAESYCQRIYQPLRADVYSRYPFVVNGRDLSIATFVDFFKPGTGQIATYYASALSSRFPLAHGTYTQRDEGASKTPYNPRFVDFLNRVKDLSDAMFPTGADSLRVEFDVRIEDNPAAALTQLQIGEQKAEHTNGPVQWQRMQWPGEKPSDGAFIVTRGQLARGTLKREGEWGFFELLEAGTVTGSSADEVFVVQWDLKDQSAGVVTIRFRPVEEETPFFGSPKRGVGFMELFRNPALLSPPNPLAHSVARCEEPPK